MESYVIFKNLAIIIISAEFFGLLARRLKAPQVVGQIIAGLIIGPCALGLVGSTDFLSDMAEIGVILLMFSAGLETDLKDLLKTGPKAFLIACMGVFIPLVGGFLLGSVAHGFAMPGTDVFLKNLFIGVIMTATSVGITVQALRELGHLKGTVGTTILSAAIIDDVIGIIVLTFVIGMKNPDQHPVIVILNTILFFVLSGIIGFALYKFLKRYDRKYRNHRRIPIIGLVLCFALSYVAEAHFGIADITGAYVAGIILCNIRDADYIARKMEINSYMIFGPIFFASIGLKTEITGFSTFLLWFSIAFVVVACITKIVGCGITSKLIGFSKKDSMKIGAGMMTRGEVALIVSQKGLSVGLLDASYFTSVILLIVISSIVTPIVLKVLYHGENSEDPIETRIYDVE
ncbi:MAG: cation:proton antiporter [Velocimicrobium sp.]